MDWFGDKLVAGDFDGDGYDDLAIRVAHETVGSIEPRAVNVIYGSSSGLSSAGNQFWHQNSPGVLGVNEVGDTFGSALAAGDIDGDGYDELIIGNPCESIGSIDDAGAVNVLYGSSSGLTSTGNQMWHQNSPDILGICEENDIFGAALGVGDFDGDGYADVTVGVSSEDVGTTNGAGAVNVLYGSSLGLSSKNNQMWHQNSPEILGICEQNDWFSFALS
jgi:disulfide bond formation protein DsbB